MLLRTWRFALVRLLPFSFLTALWWYVFAHSQHHVTDSSDRFMAQEQNSAHPFTLSHQLGNGAHGTDPMLNFCV